MKAGREGGLNSRGEELRNWKEAAATGLAEGELRTSCREGRGGGVERETRKQTQTTQERGIQQCTTQHGNTVCRKTQDLLVEWRILQGANCFLIRDDFQSSPASTGYDPHSSIHLQAFPHTHVGIHTHRNTHENFNSCLLVKYTCIQIHALDQTHTNTRCNSLANDYRGAVICQSCHKSVPSVSKHNKEGEILFGGREGVEVPHTEKAGGK